MKTAAADLNSSGIFAQGGHKIISVGSTEFLRILEGPGRYALLQYAPPRGSLKRDLVSLKDGAGHDLSLTSGHFNTSQLELPVTILKDLLAASFMAEDGDDGEGSTILRITADGRRAAEEAGGVI